jgi:hypothetical protein
LKKIVTGFLEVGEMRGRKGLWAGASAYPTRLPHCWDLWKNSLLGPSISFFLFCGHVFQGRERAVEQFIALGFEFADLAVEEPVELVGRFAGDEDGVGEEAMAGVALAAFGFSFFRGGALGEGSVGRRLYALPSVIC